MRNEPGPLRKGSKKRYLECRQLIIRSYAAGLIENAEVHWQENSGLTDEELDEAQCELIHIAARIEATIRRKQPEDK